jgi:hypothetical protein
MASLGVALFVGLLSPSVGHAQGASLMPAVDGINGKVAAFGGGTNDSGFYGGTGSIALPVARQWGLQLDGVGASIDGNGAFGGAAHLFWRDPSIGLLGAYAAGFDGYLLSYLWRSIGFGV